MTTIHAVRPETPLRVLLFICCLAAVALATPAPAGRTGTVCIPATITGTSHARLLPSIGYDKWYGRLTYDHYYDPRYNDKRINYGFLQFNLDTLPDGCRLESVQVNYCQHESWSTGPGIFTNLCLIPDPVPLEPEVLFNVIVGGREVVATDTSPDGWRVRNLNSDGIRAVDSCHRTGLYVAFGIRIQVLGGFGSYGGYAFGSDSAPAPYLRVTYLDTGETDIQAVRAELTAYPLTIQGSDTALLTLTNGGLCASDPFWAYASLPEQPRESARVERIGIGETALVRVALPAAETANAFANYLLWADESHDGQRSNDSLALRCWTFPGGTYAAQGFDDTVFPPSGWSSVNNDGGSQAWQRSPYEPMGHGGPGFALSAREQPVRNDDWLMSGPICPRSDDTDSVGLFACLYQATPPQALKVWALRGLSVADTIALLSSVSLSNTTYRRHTVSLDAFDGDTVYAGFQNANAGDWNAICLDDIWFSRVFVPGTSEPAAGVPMRPTLTIEPNPASGGYTTVRYGLGNRPTVKLALRDVLGRAVATIALDPSGLTRLDLRGITPGVYVATLEPSSPLISGKLIITAPR